jgi:acetyl esterase
MPLHPQLRAMRDRRVSEGVPPLYTLTLAEARAADLAAIRADAGDPEPVHEVLDRELPGPAAPLPVRLYQPGTATGQPGTATGQPALVYLFGGGWALGSLDTADGVCRALANRTGALVLAVGYRLAPEAPFPAAVEDCYAATVWLAAHAGEVGVDPTRIAVAGDSAGGNLAAAVTLLARERGGVDLVGQVLVYPNTEHRADTESMREATDPALFNRTSVAWYWSHYLSTESDGRDPLASPLLADSLAGLPPALVITAEYDPLRDEGERYAGRLAADGVPVEISRYDGMAHGFFTMTGALEESRRALDQVADRLRRWYERPGRVEPAG